MLRMLGVLIALLVILGASWHSQTSRAGVEDGPAQVLLDVHFASVNSGSELEVGLRLDGVGGPGLGSYVIDVLYDQNAVTVEGCGDVLFGDCFIAPENVRFQGIAPFGVSGDLLLGRATLTAHEVGETFLDVEVFTIFDAEGSELAHIVAEPALVTVKEPGEPTATEEPLPGLDDTATPAETATPGPPTPSPTMTGTPGEATPTPTPVTASIRVFTFDATYDARGVSAEFFEINLFEGEGCLGTPIASGLTEQVNDAYAYWDTPPVPAGTFSISAKPRAGWEVHGPFCRDVDLDIEASGDVLGGNIIVFRFGRRPNGDVNNDGVTNSLDALLLLQFDAQLVTEFDGREKADVNLDGNINALDVALILQFDAGLLGSLPVD